MGLPVPAGTFFRRFLGVLLGSALLLAQADPVWAQKGRSYSSGSPSPPSGRSGSSGWGGTSPNRGGSSGGFRNGSGGGSSYDFGAAAAQKRVESQRRYEQRDRSPTPSGGSWTWPAPPSGRDSGSVIPPSYTPKGRDYSTGGGWERSPKGRAGGSYDVAAAEAQRREESRTKYTKGDAPRSTYPDPKGKAQPVDPGDPRVIILRQRPWDWWIQHERRKGDFSRRFPPPSGGPVVVYSDPYSLLFWSWLLRQSLETRALWAYDHKGKMDPARYRDLLAKDGDLANRVRELEKSGRPRDPSYVPPGIEPDLMYTDEYLDAVVNPAPKIGIGIPTTVIEVLAKIFLVLVALAFLFWLVFVKQWGEMQPRPRVAKQGRPGRRRRRR
jgi:hypothetical protein